MPPIDPYQSEALTRNAPPRNARVIVPSDTEDLPVRPTYVWCESADASSPISLRVQMGDEAVTLNFMGGDGVSISPSRIYATGTTASRIILFW